MPAREQVQKIQGLGAILSGRLRAMKLSQTALARNAGISRQTLYRVLHADEVTSQVAKRIAAVVGSDLLALSDAGRSDTSILSSYRGAPDATSRSLASDSGRGSRPLVPSGEVLEILREDIGISQEEMAQGAGISLTTYQRIIRGEAKPKDRWLLAWGEGADLSDPKAMLILKSFAGPSTRFHHAIGRQIRAWRVSSGLDLLDVAEALHVEPLHAAMYEAGDDEAFLLLDDIAPFFGTSSEVLYRAAVLASADEEDTKWRPPVERILTFEAAQRSARAQQDDRDRDRAAGTWDFETASELSFVRARAGYDVEQVARMLKKSKKLIEQWEEGDREPRAADFEKMAQLYRTTPWQLQYGGPWQRAIAFPNALESRSLIFAAILPNEARAWLFRFLGELARLGFDDTDLDSVRTSLTDPSLYYDIQFAESASESVLFVRGRLRELAEETWRNIKQPEWIDSRGVAELSPLPPVFHDDSLDLRAAERVILEVGRRRARTLASQAASTSPSPEAEDHDPSRFRFDPFSYYHPRLTDAEIPKKPATNAGEKDGFHAEGSDSATSTGKSTSSSRHSQ